MALAIRLKFEPVRSLSFNSIGASYMGVGTGLTNPASQIFIQNLTDAELMFSFDGVNNHFPLAANGYFLSDVGSNQSRNLGFYIAAGDRLYVKRSGVPSSGTVYFSVMYGSDN